MLLKIILIIIGLIVICLIVWACFSGNHIRKYKDENGNPLPGSISEKFLMDINGAKNGFFINGKDINNPVLLLVSSGPGSDDYFLTDRYMDMHIDDLFTVVYWDYRGMGIAYDSKLDPASITNEVLLEDVKTVTEYLKERFSQEKIYIMGFSGGTHIALRAVQKHPEDYIAYIALAQVVTDSAENDTLIYEFMKERFTERNDQRRLKKLEAMVHQEEDGLHCDDWGSFIFLLHDAGGGTVLNKSEFWGVDMPVTFARCYTITEKINYIRGLKMYRTTTFSKEMEHHDYRDSIPRLDIPVYFISGDTDYNCPWPLVEDYCNRIEAPDKKFYKIKNAAHSALWENSDDSYQAMQEIKERTYD